MQPLDKGVDFRPLTARQGLVTAGSLSAGIEFPYARLAILTDTQIAASGLRRAKHKKQTCAPTSTEPWQR